MRTPNRWTKDDRRRFADGNRLRASTIPSRRRPGPSADEWDLDELLSPSKD